VCAIIRISTDDSRVRAANSIQLTGKRIVNLPNWADNWGLVSA